jgi:hypothetical protein
MRNRALEITTGLIALVLLAGPARAAVGMFVDATPDSTCSNTGPIVIGNTTSPIVLDLCVTIGPTHSPNPCRLNSTGDDVCAFHVGVDLNTISGFIQNFSPSSTAVKYWPQTFTSSTRAMKFAYVGAATQPTSAGPFKIGTLTVNATPVGGARVLASGFQVVDSGLQPRLVPSATLATLPEPKFVAQIATGVLALALLHRARVRDER